jgi:glycerophosphoryl diester phosphodiesterase
LADQLLLLGHRGARRYADENTLAAFDLALDHGAHGFEFDVRRTRDLHTVIVHDPKLHGLVLRRHNLHQIEARCEHLRHAAPPSLEDVLDRYGRTAFLNIEVKVRGIEAVVAHAVRRVQPKRYFISSFLPGVIKRLHRLDRTLVLGALAQTPWQLRRWKILPAEYVVPHYRLLTPRVMLKLKAAGRKVVTWTVNDPRHMRRAAELGVDGIISDDTKLLVATLG